MRDLFRRGLGIVLFGVLCLCAQVELRATDLSITAANVAQVSGVPQQYTAGATITQGQSVYIDTNNKAQLAKATSATTVPAIGVALNSASSGQPIIVLTSGTINIGATVTVGTYYVVSAANAGGIAPYADLANPNGITFIGYGSSASNITLTINATGLTHP